MGNGIQSCTEPPQALMPQHTASLIRSALLTRRSPHILLPVSCSLQPSTNPPLLSSPPRVSPPPHLVLQLQRRAGLGQHLDDVVVRLCGGVVDGRVALPARCAHVRARLDQLLHTVDCGRADVCVPYVW